MFIGTASAAFFVLGAVPMGWLADRVQARADRRRRRACSSAFFVFLSGLAVSAFMLFWTRFATGIAKANSIPVHQSLIADNYPIGIRARMSAVDATWAAHGIGLASPVLVARRSRRGPAASRAGAGRGSSSASRSSIVALARVLHEGAAARAVREGRRARRGDRGREPGADLDGGRVRPAQEDPHDPHRARRRSARSASGCSASRRCASLYLDDTLHVDRRPRARASSSASAGIAALPFLPFVGALLRPRRTAQNPAKALALVGVLILPSALFTPLQFSTHSNALVRASSSIPQAVLTTCAFAMVGAGAAGRRARTGCAAWAPRWRRCTSSSSAASCGGLIAGFLTDAIGVRGTVIILGVPDERSSAGCC